MTPWFVPGAGSIWQMWAPHGIEVDSGRKFHQDPGNVIRAVFFLWHDQGTPKYAWRNCIYHPNRDTAKSEGDC